MTLKRLEYVWELYKQGLLLDEETEERIQTIRQAFYLGAGASFSILTNGISDAAEVTEGDLNVIAELEGELDVIGLSFTSLQDWI